MNEKRVTDYIERKTLLYKTDVEYGDYTINHVLGCSHDCKYPCYAMLMSKRFGKIKNEEEWKEPKLVKNAMELLKKELPKYRDKIKFVHFCFTTDPFMYGYKEISDLTINMIKEINKYNIKCTALTKGVLPKELIETSKKNEFGITLISLNEEFRKEYEPNSATYQERIESLKYLHDEGFKTWVSIEPYPTPNIIEQNFDEILEKIKFVDKIIFGKLNYNKLVSQYKGNKEYFNTLSEKVIEFSKNNKTEWHIKDGTISK